MSEKAAKVDFKGLLKQRSFVRNYAPPQEEVLLRIDSRVVGTLGNFVTFSGQAKAGKSTFLSSTIASAYNSFKSLYSIELRPVENRPVIAYWDTESSQFDFYRQLEKIKIQATIAELPKTFNAFCVREDEPKLIRQLIEEYLKLTPQCSILIVDGLLDTLDNFNDEIESKKTINWLKYLTKTYNILLIGVIHLSRKDNVLLGHFGSMLERYSQTVLEVVKDKETGIIEMKPKYMRSDKDFMSICLNWTQYGFEKCLPPAPPEMKKRAK